MRLIEPVALLDPPGAADAVRQKMALPFRGGPAAFAMIRLIEGDGATSAPMPVIQIPPDWRDLLAPLVSAPPRWAELPEPAIMAILNVTPDSFSDGGDHLAASDAIAAGRAMAAAGADVIDVGGESTRPLGSKLIDPAEEQDRVLPVLRGLAGCGARLSIDTRNAATMQAALLAGADIVNDISGLAYDPAAAGVVAAAGCPLVLMHMRGTPQTMHEHARYADPIVEVVRELAGRVAAAEAAGIPRSRIAIDPGIGFAKRLEHNVVILARLPLLANLGCRVLLGVSRKRFIMRLGNALAPKAAAAGSVAAALFGLSRGASVLRVHDLPDTVQAVRVWQALSGSPPATFH